MLTHKHSCENTHKHASFLCLTLMCIYLWFLRPPGGYAGSHGQLQHHSQGAEAAVQYAEGRQRHLGKLVGGKKCD